MTISNTMKASQLIERLQAMIDSGGDLDVILPIGVADKIFALQAVNIEFASEIFGRSLRQTVIAIGMRKPSEYQFIPAKSGWSHDLAEAPVGEEVSVFRRTIGQDVGVKDAAGDWRVRLAGTGEHLWKVADGGVLAWKPRP